MPGKKLSAYVIPFLVILRVLPSGRNKVDLIGLVGWTSFIIGITTVCIYFTYPIYTMMFSKTIPGIFTLLTGLIIPLLQIVLTLPALSYLFMKNPYLADNIQLHNPRYLIMFCFNAVLYLAFYSIVAFTFKREGAEEASYICLISYYGLWTLAMILTSFVIGACLEEFGRKIAHTDYPSTKTMADLYQDLKQLKKGLSPVLFMMLTTKCIILINNALTLATHNIEYRNVLGLMTTVWDLAYVVLALDTTISEYKALTLKLRYVS